MEFEGEYLNGKINGKGREYYYDGKILFEGEYLNGKKWNGIGYNIKGNIEFEIKEGKGNIKEYDYDGELMFEGEYLNGEKNGKARGYYYNGQLKFEEEYIIGKKWDGKGFNKNNEIEYEIKDSNGM